MDLGMKNEATEQSYSCDANWKRAELDKISRGHTVDV